MSELELGSERPGPLSRVTASRLDALPRGLAAALAARDALISDVRGHGKRVFVTADTPAGKLFARYSDDPDDVSVFAHEAEARRIVGTRGLLRAPLVLDDGEGWLLEQALVSERIRRSHASDTPLAPAAPLPQAPPPPRLPPPSRASPRPASRGARPPAPRRGRRGGSSGGSRSRSRRFPSPISPRPA